MPGICDALGKSYSWVRSRIDEFETLAEIRLDKGGARPRKHYAPEVHKRLAELNAAEQASRRSLFDHQHDDEQHEPT